ncbi:microtubule-associated serine/threonine-protein kinase 3-like [Dendrobates tinctorius]|uniref:microtubule-associated serine/threonine-protein kinase 3-like n=1 Tax=Dendrobates tinctorius TaxID=92724 RepID=UPI003CCA2646
MSDFETSKLISGGCFGAVYLVQHKYSQQIFAMKKMAKKNLETEKHVEAAFLERDIMTFADCPFVVSMLCSFPTRSHLCMVMEYVGGGDCGSLLSTRGRLSIPLARLYFAETVLAVEYLHSYGVVHRDLKPYNLLITTAGHIKVADFGLSKIGVMIPKTNTYKQSVKDISREFKDLENCGTLNYMAPEVILMKDYGRPVDWWSMGIILHEFLVGSLPFDTDFIPELKRMIVMGKIPWNYKRCPPREAKNLITDLLKKNPEQRLGTGGAFEIKDHPFMKKLDFDNLLNQKPMYIPHLVSDVDTSLFINHAHRDMLMVSENEEDTSEDNDSDFQNFTSSSERLSKLCTIATIMMNNENSKSNPECYHVLPLPPIERPPVLTSIPGDGIIEAAVPSRALLPCDVREDKELGKGKVQEEYCRDCNVTDVPGTVEEKNKVVCLASEPASVSILSTLCTETECKEAVQHRSGIPDGEAEPHTALESEKAFSTKLLHGTIWSLFHGLMWMHNRENNRDFCQPLHEAVTALFITGRDQCLGSLKHVVKHDILKHEMRPIDK